MTQPRRGSGGSAAGSSDVGSTAGRRRKSMPTEASVALRCLRATVTELEEAHEAIGALLRLNDSAAWQKQLEQKDAELASLRAELRAKAAQVEAPAAEAGGGGAAEAARKLEELEAHYGAQLGAMTQKNAQMRVELKQTQQRLKERDAELEAERMAHTALAASAAAREIDGDDGDPNPNSNPNSNPDPNPNQVMTATLSSRRSTPTSRAGYRTR